MARAVLTHPGKIGRKAPNGNNQPREKFLKTAFQGVDIYRFAESRWLTPVKDELHYPLDPILNPQICLREDHHGFMQGDKPFFRKLGGVYGVAQPNLKGLKEIFREIGGKGQKVVWTSLRSEPVVYLKGEPYSPKAFKDIDLNLSFPGADAVRVEAQENQLQKEILEKIARGEPILVCSPDKQSCELKFKPGELLPEEVKTSSLVMREFAREYRLDYQRIPVDDLHKPDPEDFDALVQRFRDFDPEASYLANCMGGWGRTTTAMTAFCCMRTGEHLYSPAARAKPVPGSPVPRDVRDGKPYTHLTAGKLAEKIVKDFVVKDGKGEEFLSIIEEQAKIGCHLAKEISRAARETPERVEEYSERYFYLAYFYRYCREQGPENYRVPFSQWIKPHRREIRLIVLGLAPLFKGEAAWEKMGVK